MNEPSLVEPIKKSEKYYKRDSPKQSLKDEKFKNDNSNNSPISTKPQQNPELGYSDQNIKSSSSKNHPNNHDYGQSNYRSRGPVHRGKPNAAYNNSNRLNANYNSINSSISPNLNMSQPMYVRQNDPSPQHYVFASRPNISSQPGEIYYPHQIHGFPQAPIQNSGIQYMTQPQV